MFEIMEIKPCADNEDNIQAHCSFEFKSLTVFKQVLDKFGFKTVIIGSPQILIGRRSDAMLLVSETSLSASRVKNTNYLIEILEEIFSEFKNYEKVF